MKGLLNTYWIILLCLTYRMGLKNKNAQVVLKAIHFKIHWNSLECK